MKVKSERVSRLFEARGRLSRGAAAALLVLTVCGCSSTVSQETTSSVTRAAGYPLPDRKPVQGKQAVAQRAVKLMRTTYLGRAPYICTPSGFGSTSRCFLR